MRGGFTGLFAFRCEPEALLHDGVDGPGKPRHECPMISIQRAERRIAECDGSSKQETEVLAAGRWRHRRRIDTSVNCGRWHFELRQANATEGIAKRVTQDDGR